MILGVNKSISEGGRPPFGIAQYMETCNQETSISMTFKLLDSLSKTIKQKHP